MTAPLPAPFLTDTVLQVEPLIRRVTSAEHGAVVVFQGVVRNRHQGKPVQGLEYTSYPAMAEDVARTIVHEAEMRWPVRVAAMHRVGALDVGECAVIVAVGAGHREEAFMACQHVIDEIKRRVPIWKHERYADGSADWVDPMALDEAGTTGPRARASDG